MEIIDPIIYPLPNDIVRVYIIARLWQLEPIMRQVNKLWREEFTAREDARRPSRPRAFTFAELAGHGYFGLTEWIGTFDIVAAAVGSQHVLCAIAASGDCERLSREWEREKQKLSRAVAVATPHELRTLTKRWSGILPQMLHAAVGTGREQVAAMLIKWGGNTFDAKTFDDMLAMAAQNGHIDLCVLAREHGARDSGTMARSAALYGYYDIAALAIGWGGAAVREAVLSCSAAKGHVDIFRLAISHGACDFDNALAAAAKGGHIEICKLAMNAGAANFGDALTGAASGGHTNICKLMIERGAANLDDALETAAERDYTDTCKLLLERGVTRVDDALGAAASSDASDACKLLLERGATRVDDALICGAACGRVDLCELARARGATDFEGMLVIATNTAGRQQWVLEHVMAGTPSEARHLELIRATEEVCQLARDWLAQGKSAP